MDQLLDQELLGYLVTPRTSKEVREWAFASGRFGAVEALLELEKAGRVVKYQPLTGAATYRAVAPGAAPPKVKRARAAPAERDQVVDRGMAGELAEPDEPVVDRAAAIAAAAKRRASSSSPSIEAPKQEAPAPVPKPAPPAVAPVREKQMSEKWITVADTATLLGLSKAGVRMAFNRGALGDRQKTDGLYCFERAAVEKFAAARETPATKKAAVAPKHRAAPREKKAAPRTPGDAGIVERLRWEAEGCERGFVTVEQLGQRVLEMLAK